MSIVIKAEGLSKMYHIGRQKSGNLREAVSDAASSIFSGTKEDPTEYWALKNISFKLEEGEVLGIIGRNGAGKSTLLKILSRITEPTEGKVEIEGRVASLLEVGTGFHPELSGRENIFMNGAILGMKRAEIRKKFDEIVSFSGIEQFIDTPVKRYSSGMYVRLAFAVAAHLEPEILIVDEVLAVGDAEFQKKCLGKMKDVSRQEGRTVLFVSHSMSAIESLCNQCMLLQLGKIHSMGEVEKVVEDYRALAGVAHAFTDVSNGIFHVDISTSETASGINVIKTYCDGQPTHVMHTGCTFTFEAHVKNYSSSNNVVLGFVIKDSVDRSYVAINNHHLNIEFNRGEAKDFVLKFEMKNFPFYGDDRLVFDVYFGDGIYDFQILREAFFIQVEHRNFYRASLLPDPALNKIIIPEIVAQLIPEKETALI